jgi:lamin B
MMSTRSRTRRSPSITKAATSSTSMLSSQSSNRSPPSPQRLTRLKEKEDLQNLNDRLIVYIETVKRLEAENSRLQSYVQSTSETSFREVGEIKALYERELEDSKRLIDELARDKAKLEIECTKYKSQEEDALNKFKIRDRDAKQFENKIKQHENELIELKSSNTQFKMRIDDLTNEYKTKFEKLNGDLKRLNEDNVNLRNELDNNEKKLNIVQTQLEDETILRVDLENKNQTLREDLQFKSNVYEKEIEQLRSAKRTEIEQHDKCLRDEYDSRLVLELQRIRDEAEFKIANMKDDVERRYHSKYADLESNSRRSMHISSQFKEEISNYKSKIDELDSEIDSLKAKIHNQDIKLKEQDDKYKRLQAQYETDFEIKDSQVRDLRKELDELLSEYQELYDIKIQLDMEIGAYRKLLESEEQRLNITSHCASSGFLSGSYIADDSVLRAGKKRRLVDTADQDDELLVTSSSTKAQYTQSDTTSCGVKVVEHDFEGKSIKLINVGDKEVNLSGWILKRYAQEQEVEFKFPKNTIIKPNQTITIWSANSGVTQELPNDLVMSNNNKWVVGDKMITALVDKSNNEQARRESLKKSASPKSTTTTTVTKSETKVTTSNGSGASRMVS